MLVVKTLIGLSALVSDDAELKDLVFGPFSLDGKLSKQTAIANYFNYVKDYFGRTTGPTTFVEYWKNYFQIDAIIGIVKNKLTEDLTTGTNQTVESNLKKNIIDVFRSKAE